MGATYFQDFTRDNGLPVTVEYGVSGGYSAPTYSPLHGADGGDAPEFMIIKAWPNTAGHHWLAARSLYSRSRLLSRFFDALERLDMWWRASLTDAERERMEAWLAEHYVEEPYDDEPEWR